MLELIWNWSSLYNAFFDKAKFVTIVAGRRTGKTYNAFQWLLSELYITDAHTALWVDTVHNNIESYVERYLLNGEGIKLKPILKNCGAEWNSQKKILKLNNNKFIQFGSAERPELLEGFEYDRIILNEAGIILKKPQLWQNSIEPMCKGSSTKVRFIGTPKGKNLFYQLSKKNNVQYKNFHFSGYDSPYWNNLELSEIKKNVPEIIFRQEYLGEFIEDSGAVFRNIEEAICNDIEGVKIDNSSYSIGVDWGQSNDFTALTVYDIDKNKVVEVDRFNQISWEVQRGRLIALIDKYKPITTVAERNSIGSPNIEALQGLGYNITPFNTTQASKSNIIEKLIYAFESKLIKIPNNEILINELKSYEMYKSKNGLFSYSAPQGEHDDTVISLALAYFGATKINSAWY
jgi:phage terminase large subunit